MNKLSVLRPFTRWLLRRDLKHAFRRVCWVGQPPQIEEGRPLVAYANHNNFYDGHLIWLACRRVLRRDLTIWMREWDRFPIFAPEGALPFPANDPQRRSRTIRTTAARMSSSRPHMLAYFPAGELRSPEHGLPDFDERTFRRLNRIMPSPMWVPLGIHVTWWGDSRPTALIAAGPPVDSVTGLERRQLAAVLEFLSRPNPRVTTTICDGSPGPHERWDLSFMRWLFQ